VTESDNTYNGNLVLYSKPFPLMYNSNEFFHESGNKATFEY